jgi:hypothetical protein
LHAANSNAPMAAPTETKPIHSNPIARSFATVKYAHGHINTFKYGLGRTATIGIHWKYGKGKGK